MVTQVKEYKTDLHRKLTEKVDSLCNGLQKYSQYYKASWQRIPYLALMADGKFGWNEKYRKAYTKGYWPLDGSEFYGNYTIYIDLETGRLLNAASVECGREPVDAFQCDLLRFAHNLEPLIPADVIERLKDVGCQNYGEWMGNREIKQIKQHQERIMDLYGILPNTYVRKKIK